MDAKFAGESLSDEWLLVRASLGKWWDFVRAVSLLERSLVSLRVWWSDQWSVSVLVLK